MLSFSIPFILSAFIGTPIPAPPINVMTYNIRFDNPQDGPNSWNNRKTAIIDMFNQYQPDIIGIQEGLDSQVRYMQEKLPNHRYLGVGRDDGKKKGEYSAIFYRKDRFKLLKGSTFWLSEQPDKPSKGWDAALERICTYALFQDSITKSRFWVFNTHFDHVGEIARVNSSKLILLKLEELKLKDDYPVILMGDFNATEVTDPIKILKSELSDSREASKVSPRGPNYTFNNFNPSLIGTDRIDFIFVDHNRINVTDYVVIDDKNRDNYLSDHFPVLITVVL